MLSESRTAKFTLEGPTPERLSVIPPETVTGTDRPFGGHNVDGAFFQFLSEKCGLAFPRIAITHSPRWRGRTAKGLSVQPGCTSRRSYGRKALIKSEVERQLTGKETEPWEIIYFKLYQSQLPRSESP